MNLVLLQMTSDVDPGMARHFSLSYHLFHLILPDLILSCTAVDHSCSELDSIHSM